MDLQTKWPRHPLLHYQQPPGIAGALLQEVCSAEALAMAGKKFREGETCCQGQEKLLGWELLLLTPV